MKSWLLFIPALLFFSPIFTQTANSVTLTTCYADARAHTALAAQPALLAQQHTLRMQQIETGKMPDITLNGRATFQSEQVDLGIDNPLFQSPNLPLFQYRATVDASYTLYDGGYRQALLEQERTAHQLQAQRVEVERFALYERINQPFFSILLLRKKIALLENSRDELFQRIQSLEGAVQAGARLPSDVERMRVQALRLDAEIDKARHDIRGLFHVLEALTGQSYTENTALLLPVLDATPFPKDNKRPELQYFLLQQEQTLRADAIAQARRKPKVSVFAQAGLGAPNPLNFFNDNLSPFGIIGAQVTWKIADWQQTQREQEILQVQRNVIETQKNHFLQQVNLLDDKFREDLASLESAIQHQEAIAKTQEAIKQESAVQLEQGVQTATDYLGDVQTLLQTRLHIETLMLQIQQLKIDYLTLKGLL